MVYFSLCNPDGERKYWIVCKEGPIGIPCQHALSACLVGSHAQSISSIDNGLYFFHDNIPQNKQLNSQNIIYVQETKGRFQTIIL